MALFRVVVFDFDYTLADSSRGVLECVNYALGCLGLPGVAAEDVYRTIGLSLPDAFVRLVGDGFVGMRDEFVALFTGRADEVMAGMTAVFEEVPLVLGHLRGRGVSLGIVSTKFRYRIEEILEREGLLGYFDVVVGGEDVSRHKPDPEGLLTALHRLGGSKADFLYVGDSVVDAEAARHAGIPFAAVLSGVTPRESFRNFPVHVILENLGELTEIF